MIKQGLLFVGVFCVLQGPAPADGDVLVRTKLSPEDSVTLGERVVLSVDVLAKDAWAKLPTLPRPEIAGAIVFEPPSQSTRLSESIEGGSYTGQRYEWWVYPKRTGALRVPAMELTVSRTVFGSDPSPEPTVEKTESLFIDVRTPSPEANGVSIVTTRLDATQTWSDIPEALHVGDGITRKIQREIDDAPALILPPIEFTAPSGVRVFAKQPSTNNQFNRGSLKGTRTDAVTYLFETPGKVDLPKVEVRWWNSRGNQLKSIMLEGVSIDVLPARDEVAPQEASDAGRESGREGVWALLAACSCLVLGGCVWWNRRTINAWFQLKVSELSDSEAMCFHRLRRATRSNDAAAILRALTGWSDCVQIDHPIPRIQGLFESHGDHVGLQELDELTRCVDADRPFDARVLLQRVQAVRKQRRRFGRMGTDRSNRSKGNVLPPLYARSASFVEE